MFALPIAAFASNPEPEEKPENIEMLTRANELIEEEKYAEAESLFRKLLKKDLTTSTAGMVSFNLGITLRLEKKYDESISVFEGILKSSVDDRDSSGELMEVYRNYKHRSCIQIAIGYEVQENYTKALEYIKMASDTYKYQADCGTCAEQSEDSLKKWTKHLEEKILEQTKKK